MLVNGLQLPTAFVELISQDEVPVEWNRKGSRDAYGHQWWSDFEPFMGLETIGQETRRLPSIPAFAELTPEEIRERNVWGAHEDGFIPYITDFTAILQFGKSPDGNLFCFDYRHNPQEPSVICWEDGYWRRVAPNFATFIGLFTPGPVSWSREKVNEYERLLGEMPNRYGDGPPAL